MKVRALRGVCIGVDRHLQPGDEADLDAATVQFLTSIGAVAKVDEPAPAEPHPETAPVKSAKKEK